MFHGYKLLYELFSKNHMYNIHSVNEKLRNVGT